MIKVEVTLVEDSKTAKYQYSDVPGIEDSWIDSKRYVPAPFDLVECQAWGDKGYKTVVGWWTGHSWDGLKLNKDDNVEFWKRKF